MKRFHIHVAVTDLTASIRFYSALFAAKPIVVKRDYAKWMFEDPRVNFAISQHGTTQGIAWESYHTLNDIPVFSESRNAQTSAPASEVTACCAPSSGKPVGIPVKPSSRG